MSSPSEIKSGDNIEKVHKVLVLATGGTIVMKVNEDGKYAPHGPDEDGRNIFTQELRKMPLFHEKDGKSSEDHCVLKNGVDTIYYRIIESNPQLDSSNIVMDDWKKMAEFIEEYYSKYDGFVILHGTDTMAYTASALAFMLENLSKPVILTGAQIPIFEPRSDGRDNFLGALILAANYPIPEVCVYFNATLLRGCRSTKMDCESFDAFSSPNARPLANVGVDITVHWEDVLLKPESGKKFRIFTDISTDVGLLTFFPGISDKDVINSLQERKGVVIESYGAGNGPSAREDIFKALEEASARGVILINITQCPRGAVKELYETGAALARAGIRGGSDLTREAALTKLAYVIGLKDVFLKEKKEMMVRNLRGEMSYTPEKVALLIQNEE